MYCVEKMEATLHRALYLESSRFAKERESIFRNQWLVAASVSGTTSRPLFPGLSDRHGLYAPMEDLSLDIRTHIAARLNSALPSD